MPRKTTTKPRNYRKKAVLPPIPPPSPTVDYHKSDYHNLLVATLAILVIVTVGFFNIGLPTEYILAQSMRRQLSTGSDLVISPVRDMITPRQSVVGDEVTLTIAVQNRGNRPATASEASLAIDGKEIGRASVGSLRGGSMQTVAWTWIATDGWHVVRFCADVGNTVAETNDSNNCGSVRIKVYPSDPSSAIPIGDVRAELDSSSPPSAIIVGGQIHAEMSRFRFSARNDDIKITSLRITTSADSADDDTAMIIITYPTNTAGTTTESVEALLHQNGTAPGYADFSNLNFVVPKNSSAVLVVKANIAPVGVNGEGADSGDQIGLNLDFDSNFQATGVNNPIAISSLVGVTADISGWPMIVRKTKPIVRTVPAFSSFLSVGERDLANIKIVADVGGIDWSELTVDISGQLGGAAIGDSDGSTMAESVTTAAGTQAITNLRLLDASGNDVVGFGTGAVTYTNSQTGTSVRFEPAVPQALGGGSVATYTIKGTVLTASMNDAIFIRVNRTATSVVTAPKGTVDDQLENRDFIWSDRSAVPHSMTSSDWTNGYKVQGLPTANVGLSA